MYHLPFPTGGVMGEKDAEVLLLRVGVGQLSGGLLQVT